MSDLTDRLRAEFATDPNSSAGEAADAIEAQAAERNEARANVEHLTAEVARLREALDDYAERLHGADGELTLIIATKQVGPEFTRLTGKREGVRLALDYLRPLLADTEERTDG